MSSYHPFSKWMHWFIALLIIPMVIGSFYINDLPKDYQSTVIAIHQSFGLLVLCLMLVRIGGLYRVGRPPLPIHIPLWEKRGIRIVQYLLYSTLIIMPLVGWAMSSTAGRDPCVFGLVMLPFPGVSYNKMLSDTLFQVHRFIAFFIIGLLILHIIGALKHYFIDKDHVMQSMLP